jgi:hypothetical protein
MIAHPGITTPEPPPPPPPSELDSIDPATAEIGGASFTLNCHGSNYTESSVILFDGNALATTFVSAEHLTASVDPAAAAAGAVPVTVKTGALESNAQDFTFTEA